MAPQQQQTGKTPQQKPGFQQKDANKQGAPHAKSEHDRGKAGAMDKDDKADKDGCGTSSCG